MSAFLIAATFAGLTALVLWVVNRGYNESQAIYRRLDGFREQARRVETREAMERLMADLSRYHQENIWHRSHGGYARTVLAYMKGRYEFLPSVPD